MKCSDWPRSLRAAALAREDYAACAAINVELQGAASPTILAAQAAAAHAATTHALPEGGARTRRAARLSGTWESGARLSDANLRMLTTSH